MVYEFWFNKIFVFIFFFLSQWVINCIHSACVCKVLTTYIKGLARNHIPIQIHINKRKREKLLMFLVCHMKEYYRKKFVGIDVNAKKKENKSIL